MLASLYREHQQRRGLRPRTIDKNTKAVAQYLDFAAPDDDLSHTTADTIEAFLATRAVGARTRYWWLSCLHTFYRWAIRHGHATSDPTELIDRPRVRQNLPRPIATADLAFALQGAEPTTAAMMSLMAFAGLRCMEVAGLDRADVLDTHEHPMLVVADGKGGKQRAVPLHEHTLASLRCLPLPRSGRVFDMPPWKVSQVVNRYMHGLGIDATAHCLRHWYATECYRTSHDLRLVQELLGHSSPTTTAVYTKLDMTAALPVVAKLAVGLSSRA